MFTLILVSTGLVLTVLGLAHLLAWCRVRLVQRFGSTSRRLMIARQTVSTEERAPKYSLTGEDHRGDPNNR